MDNTQIISLNSGKSCLTSRSKNSENNLNSISIVRESGKNLCYLPVLVLGAILENLSYEDLAIARGTCRAMRLRCEPLLNSGFELFGRKLKSITTDLKRQLPKRISERRRHPRNRYLQHLTSLQLDYDCLHNCFKSNLNQPARTFYPGRLLDIGLNILAMITRFENCPTVDIEDSIHDFHENVRLSTKNYFATRTTSTSFLGMKLALQPSTSSSSSVPPQNGSCGTASNNSQSSQVLLTNILQQQTIDANSPIALPFKGLFLKDLIEHEKQTARLVSNAIQPQISILVKLVQEQSKQIDQLSKKVDGLSAAFAAEQQQNELPMKQICSMVIEPIDTFSMCPLNCKTPPLLSTSDQDSSLATEPTSMESSQQNDPNEEVVVLPLTDEGTSWTLHSPKKRRSQRLIQKSLNEEGVDETCMKKLVDRQKEETREQTYPPPLQLAQQLQPKRRRKK